MCEKFLGHRRRAAALVLMSLLAGCGFHLQGPLTLPAAMDRTYIHTADAHSLFYWELRRELEAAGAEVVDAAEDATAEISVYTDLTDQRILSVSARNVPTEFEVFYTIRYSITARGDTLVPVQDLTLTRDYTYDPTLVLGKENEEQLLREHIARDLVRVVMEQAAVQ